jgi:polyisoprenoid-binding protein YceI
MFNKSIPLKLIINLNNLRRYIRKHGETYLLNGDLTIRDVTGSVNFQAEFTGAGIGFAGDERAGFEANGIISRKDFNLTWNIVANGGGLVIGDEIKLHFYIQLVKD